MRNAVEFFSFVSRTGASKNEDGYGLSGSQFFGDYPQAIFEDFFLHDTYNNKYSCKM